jgi:hypothetical protein
MFVLVFLASLSVSVSVAVAASEPATPSAASSATTSEGTPESTPAGSPQPPGTSPGAGEAGPGEAATPVPPVLGPGSTTPVSTPELPPIEVKAPVPPPPVTVLGPAEVPPPPKPIAELPPETTTPLTPITQRITEATTPTEPIAASAAEAALALAAPATGQVAAAMTSPSGGQNAASTEAASVPAAVEASSVLLGRLAVDGSGGRRPGPPASGGAAPRTGVQVNLSAAQRAGELSCQLSEMSGSVTDNCRAGWLSTRAVLATPAAGFRAGTVGTARTGPPDDGYGGTVGGNHQGIPAPGPAPSGAVGGSAAGGSGIALSGFFTLAGLLLLAAPLALRRLRLSCRPWLTAFFVLIPERPG